MVVNIGVIGAGGAMGITVCKAVSLESDMKLVAAIDPRLAGIDLYQVTGSVRGPLIEGDVVSFAHSKPDVVIDFSIADAAYENLLYCADEGIAAVVGTTGLSEERLIELSKRFAATSTGCIVAANFSIGALLMMRFAAFAAPYFQSADIVELHHERKVDAPSGTAMLTAERISEARASVAPGTFAEDPTKTERLRGARGASYGVGVQVHSLRVRGMVAHQEVILGAEGQTLTIRHDSYDRSSFMPGVLMATRAVGALTGLTQGIDWLLDADLQG